MMTFNIAEEHVLTEVDRRFTETLEFLRTLVRQPSVLGHERGVQDLVFARLSQLGLSPEMWDLNLHALRAHPSFGPLDLTYHNRPNVTAVWPAAMPGGKSLVLNGHIDVVSPEPLANWTHGPWEAIVEGDWLYGRGAGDMKAGLAAMLLAVEAIRAANVSLKGDVILESVIEEECTGNGTLACCLRGLRGDAALVPEPHGLEATLATLGIIWFRVRTRGRASHAQAADLAVNAIEKMYPVMAALRQMEAEMNMTVRHTVYQQLTHPIKLNIGVIQGGDWPSTVPSACSLECRLSFEPGGSVAVTQEQVRATVAAAARGDPWLRENPPVVEFFGFRADPSVTNPAGPAMQLLGQCHESIVGTPLAFRASTATTDQRFFLNNCGCGCGMEATSYGPTAANIHAGEERVLIPSIRQAAQVLALFTLRWCGVAE